MAEDHRRAIAPEVILAIQDAVTKAFEDNAHRCLIGFSVEDKEGMVSLKNLLHDYPADKLRESFRLMKTIVNVRNTAGNIFVCVLFGGIFIWILNKLLPGINWK